MTTTNITETNKVTITRSLAVRCGEALVTDYNNGYETRALSCNKLWFRSLYNDLRTLGCEWLIASAKGSQEIRDYGFKNK